MVWTPERTYEKPDISVRATTLYHQIVAPIMLPFLDRRLLNLFRCREGRCFFQRNREHPPTGKEFHKLVRFQPVEQKNGRIEQYLYAFEGDRNCRSGILNERTRLTKILEIDGGDA